MSEIDPHIKAETELLAAVNAIDAASQKLSKLRIPLKKNENKAGPNFEEQILEAAKSIAVVTKNLVQSTSSIQRELVSKGRLYGDLSQEKQWSNKLVSSAKHVTIGICNLCDAVNETIEGNDENEDKLISAAKATSVHTGQLVQATLMKADPNSENSRKLQRAGVQIKKATDAIVKAAQDNGKTNSFGVTIKDVETAPKGAELTLLRELEKQEEISRKQREIQHLERQLLEIQKIMAATQQ